MACLRAAYLCAGNGFSFLAAFAMRVPTCTVLDAPDPIQVQVHDLSGAFGGDPLGITVSRSGQVDSLSSVEAEPQKDLAYGPSAVRCFCLLAVGDLWRYSTYSRPSVHNPVGGLEITRHIRMT